MPYIVQKDRPEIDAGRPARTKGELNYKVTTEAIRYLDMRHNAHGEKVGYTLISEAIAALRDAADELQRRLLGPYEDQMILKNGDCYPGWLLEKAGVSRQEHEPYWNDRPDFRYTDAKED